MGLMPAAHCLLFASCAPAACRLLPAACCLPPAACRLLPAGNSSIAVSIQVELVVVGIVVGADGAGVGLVDARDNDSGVRIGLDGVNFGLGDVAVGADGDGVGPVDAKDNDVGVRMRLDGVSFGFGDVDIGSGWLPSELSWGRMGDITGTPPVRTLKA